ncbi:MAG: hypothetical protein ACN4GR_14335 [Arenicellales bacterium]
MMSRTLKKLIPASLLGFSLLISSASHAEVFRLQFKDYILGGFRTLDLHQALYNQYQLDASRLDIETIEVVLKSQHGGGLVWSGSRYSQLDRQVVTGQAVNFNNPADWTYSHIIFPAQGAAGDLKLNLNGLFKLREVLVRTRDESGAESVVKSMQGDGRVILPMFHLELTGLNSINLKQLLRSDSRLNPDEFQLKGIEVLVKSRKQGGQVWLENGNRHTEPQAVDTAGRFFASNDPGSYGRNYFRFANGNNQSKPWLLKLNGDIKLNEIVINLVPR